MTARSDAHRLVIALCGAVLILGLCLAAGALFGSTAASVVAGIAAVVVLLCSLAALRPDEVAGEPGRSSGRSAEPAPAFPSYDRLLSMVEYGLRDRRYFDRVVAPLLRGIALDLVHPLGQTGNTTSLREQFGMELGELLDPDRPAETDNTGRPRDQALIADLLDRLEPLEQLWR
jgi:hypothetical protein